MKRISLSLLIGCLLCVFVPTFAYAQDETCAADADHLVSGQALVTEGNYVGAIAAFTCAIEADPLALDAHRGRIEARLLSGAYSDAMLDYAVVMVQVAPEVPDVLDQFLAGYVTALESDPENVGLLTGYSFAQWYNFDFEGALATLEPLLALEPDSLYGVLMRGSNQLFLEDIEAGEADFAQALELAPDSADVAFIVADGYLYALFDLERALEQATRAAEMGMDTPRIDAILATCYFYMDEVEKALPYYAHHIERTTPETVEGDPLAQGQAVTIAMTPGQAYSLPIEAAAGETLILTADSPDGVDSLMVLYDADGNIVTGNDDNVELNAGFEFEVTDAGTYTLILASFEGAGSGEIVLTRE